MKETARRAAIVTGAGGGLGAAFATGLARAGLSVLVNNRHRGDGAPSADALANRLTAEGLSAAPDRHAVDAPGAAQAIVEAALEAFGRLDVLVLNAGINGAAGKIGAAPPEDLAEVMAINFFANAALVSAALPHIQASPAGRILFVSSTAGLHGLRGRAAYAASKGALNAYAVSLADEQRRAGVGVNVLMPYAETKMTGGAAGDALIAFPPERVAPAVEWLTSADCTDTGQLWVAGGGRYRRAFMVETPGAGDVTGNAAWIADRRDAIADRSEARIFRGGEAAFADMLGDVQAMAKG
ncbi:SDR family NAD(P)-dependent oxidoreductase [Allosphingosinicella indica]|uniref:NAD(P)-dependent dehydrogenase, short-chain alcohol dehydrogenase family n=1 Tax=Allosphingosinicella indica TaxID=941907 RepID=A0A1X7G010_9SPHN|nr:SDR family NAD(P)-dependent oxidoreductase [Allosphingosinicella indica]SMF61704.1 NAD(P)-dependent dehydrogenase, short-chain alcohol dehydrogenase family [Allosphingosinicella indica]